MNDPDVNRWLVTCGAIEFVAWSVAWLLDWQLGALVAAVAVSVGVATVIFELQRRKRRKG